MDSTSDPLDNQFRAYRTGSGGYWSKRFWTDRRVYVSAPTYKAEGRRVSAVSRDLTPLDEIVAPALTGLPGQVQALLKPEFWYRIEGASDWNAKFEAQAWLAGAVTAFSEAHLDIAYDFEEIETRARRHAEVCRHIHTYEGVDHYVQTKRLELPVLRSNVSARGCIARARDSRWWRRGLSKLYRRAAEKKMRDTGFVCRGRQLYASGFACAARRQQAAATRKHLSARCAVSSAGVQLNLWEVHQRSLANPAIRRAELMTRLKGFEDIATELGHVAEFITATCPSEYHCRNADGNANPNYKGHSIRDGQAWLNRIWQKTRAKLARLGILVYGFRIAEPHHDGTPHWHMVLFCSSANRDTLRDVLRKYWLSECGGEPGAGIHRIKFKSINTLEGSACGYLAKYIAKNIDGYEVGEDYEANPQAANEPGMDDPRADSGAGLAPPAPTQSSTHATNTVARVGAWAALHGIRQFQQIGGPQVTIYRELRRVRVPETRISDGRWPSDVRGHTRSTIDVAPIERARVCADAGDWRGFITCIGGIAQGRKGALSLWKEITGECNGYSELKGPQIIGVSSTGGNLRTRTEMWRVVKLGSFLEIFSALGPVTIIVRGAPTLSEPRGWTNPHETSMYGPN